MDLVIKDFVWSGQATGKCSHVDYATLIRAKDDSGLGLISVKHQTMAKVGKVMLWIVGDGDHMLQWILRDKIADLSAKR